MLTGIPLTSSSLYLLQTLSASNEQTAVASVSSQLFTALVVGLLLAFGLQFLITNLGIAIGITAFKFRSSNLPSSKLSLSDSLELPISSTTASQQVSQEVSYPAFQKKSTGLGVGTLAGLGIMSTVNLVLFAACFAAIRFSQVSDVISGATIGMVIWAAYFLIVLWLSTAAASSLLSTVLGFTVTGIGGLVTLIRGVLKRRNAAALDEKTIAAIQQQIELTLNSTNLKDALEAQLEQLSPQLDWQQVRSDLKQLLQSDARLIQLNWQQIDRSMLTALIKRQSNLADAEIEQIVNQLEPILQEVAAQTTVEAAESDQTTSESTQLETIEAIDQTELREKVRQAVQMLLQQTGDQIGDQTGDQKSWNWTDLLQQIVPQITSQIAPGKILSTVLQTQLKQLVTREIGAFFEVDEQLDELNEQLNKANNQLEHQQDYSSEDHSIKAHSTELSIAQQHKVISSPQITDQAANAKLDAELNAELDVESNAEEINTERITEIQSQLESYLRYTNPKRLTVKRIERKLQKLLQTIPLDQLSNLPALDQTTLQTILQRRKKLSQKQQRQILQQINQTWMDAIHSCSSPEVVLPADATLAETARLKNQHSNDFAENLLTENLLTENLPEENPLEEKTLEEISQPEDQQTELNALLEKVVGYFTPQLELTQATQQLKQRLLDWFTRSGQPLAQSQRASEQTSKKLSQGLEQWYGSTLQNWRDQLQQLEDEIPSWLQPQSLSESTQAYLKSKVAALQQQMLNQVDTLQQGIQAQINNLQQQAQQRLDTTRQAAAKAAWWLFSIALTAAMSAATAGALAGSGLV